MKNTKDTTFHFHRMFLGLLISTLIFSGLSAAQDTGAELSSFTIVIEATAKNLQLTCKDGCSWQQLHVIKTVDGTPQAIDQKGIRTPPKTEVGNESLAGNFIFTIAQTETGISLEGFKGTAWTLLAFSCSKNGCRQAIDQYGMTAANRLH